jgi:hypothetical protein
MPEPRRPVSQINGVRIDLATAYFLTGDLSSAIEAIKPLLASPVSVRNVSLVGRLTRTRTILRSPTWADSSGHANSPTK